MSARSRRAPLMAGGQGRRTRIVATLGPATSDARTLRALIAAGLDVARFNASHGSAAEHRSRLEALRHEAARAGRAVATLFDLQGPKIRTGPIAGAGSVRLVPGRDFVLTTRPIAGTERAVSTSYRQLPRDVRAGERVLLCDGQIELRVRRVRGTEIVCEVVCGGELTSNQGIHVPGAGLSVPALTAKDRKDLAFGLRAGFDAVALSFVRRAADVHALRRAMARAGRRVPVVAKLEKPQAMDRLEEILDASDGAMVARGDLGVELPPQRVPFLQKRIIGESMERDVFVITATQMLESMVNSPRPTRAEVSDVANAVFDGTDAVMLSEETAVGRYPVEAVAMMDAIIRDAEASAFERAPARPPGGAGSAMHSLAVAACAAARDSGAKAILAFTLTGSTALAISGRRPPVRVIGLTPTADGLRRLGFFRGVDGLLCPFGRDLSDMMRLGERAAMAAGWLQPGDRVVLVSGSVHLKGGSDLMILHSVQP